MKISQSSLGNFILQQSRGGEREPEKLKQFQVPQEVPSIWVSNQTTAWQPLGTLVQWQLGSRYISTWNEVEDNAIERHWAMNEDTKVLVLALDPTHCITTAIISLRVVTLFDPKQKAGIDSF